MGEVIAGLLADSLALITDSAHRLTDAAALVVAIVASRIVERPARGAYTWGFARVDALSGQANGLTLLLLAAWFIVEAVRRLANPPDARGGVMVVVAAVGVLVNLAASLLASRADRRSLSVRGAVAHLDETGDGTEHCTDAHGPTHVGQGFAATRAAPSERPGTAS